MSLKTETENYDLYAVSSEIAKLKNKKDQLTLKKREIETELQGFKSKVLIGGKKVNQNWDSINPRQQRLRQEILEIEQQVAPIKAELNQWYALETELRAKSLQKIEIKEGESVVVLEKIKRLRDRYLDFAEDQTRVNSMRLMAAQFANELTSILAESEA